MTIIVIVYSVMNSQLFIVNGCQSVDTVNHGCNIWWLQFY